MVKCEDCTLLEVFSNPNESYWNRCTLYGEWNIEIDVERECIDFQPGP